ncbi:Uncharacterised protein [Vibrio cholerae]|uniref:Uncharacterized protein n=1 Tax=Vibrio cholerae TaxID=666 RepID=A0A655YJE1_VIBCL|nr:Uncharacterised protein [Vibrio cholerae]
MIAETIDVTLIKLVLAGNAVVSCEAIFSEQYSMGLRL